MLARNSSWTWGSSIIVTDPVTGRTRYHSAATVSVGFIGQALPSCSTHQRHRAMGARFACVLLDEGQHEWQPYPSLWPEPTIGVQPNTQDDQALRT
ncbi:hypothetical protein GCM10007979_46720 [Nocardioides albus]|nr:hypothetical protein GCM10007979_46720 [Nocardioides albus]